MQVSSAKISEALRYCAGHCDTPEQFELVAWVTERIGDYLLHEHPRFGYNAFRAHALMEDKRYIVKCDECREFIRVCDSVEESARGGHCAKCAAELDRRYPERVANRMRAAYAL